MPPVPRSGRPGEPEGEGFPAGLDDHGLPGLSTGEKIDHRLRHGGHVDEGEPARLQHLADIVDQGCVHDARTDGVDGDLMLGQLGAERPDQADHGVFGQAVDGIGGESDETGQRRRGHDGTAAAGGHGRRHRPHAEEYAVDVDAHGPPVDVVGDLGDVGLTGGNAGIEVGQVDPPESGGDGVDDGRPRIGSADIGLDTDPTEPGGRPLRRIPVEIHQRHRRPGIGQPGGRSQADARSTPGDDRHLPRKRSHWLPHDSSTACRPPPYRAPGAYWEGAAGALGRAPLTLRPPP